MLLVELQGDDPDELRERSGGARRLIQHRRRLAFDSRMTLETEERNLFWRLTGASCRRSIA